MIHLEYNNLVNYLVSSGYFNFEQVVDNQIIIGKRQTKNNTFSVKIKKEEGIFVKQFIDNIEYPFNALWREEFIRSKELNENIKNAIIPFPKNKPNNIDEQRKVLITKLISNPSTIKDKINQNGIFDNLIEIIEDLHISKIDDLWKYRKRLNYAPIILERIFYRKYSRDGNVNLIFWSKFEKDERIKIGNILNEFWYGSVSLIHNDLNVNNILLDTDNKIYITDWEYLSLGDPLWDFAKLINNLEEEKIDKKINLKDDKEKLPFYKISIKLWLNYLDLKRGENPKLLKEISENIEQFKKDLHNVQVSNTNGIRGRQ